MPQTEEATYFGLNDGQFFGEYRYKNLQWFYRSPTGSYRRIGFGDLTDEQIAHITRHIPKGGTFVGWNEHHGTDFQQSHLPRIRIERNKLWFDEDIRTHFGWADNPLRLNNNVDRQCWIDQGFVHCDDAVWEFTIDGFPVDARSPEGPYHLAPVVFNYPPDCWRNVQDRKCEETILTPWLKSMGFTDIEWKDQVVIQHGTRHHVTIRVALMKRGKNRFVFHRG